MLDTAGSSTQFDSAELYDACRNGAPDVQADAYRALWRYLYRVALHVVRDQPDPESLAQSCAQDALIRIHRRLDECRSPAAFRSWARRIVSNGAIDTLRRRKRLLPLDAAPATENDPVSEPPPQPEAAVLSEMQLGDLRALLEKAPISARSFRVVVGRYLDDVPEETLAATESEIAGRDVQPSHIQVTRSKNIAKLRDWNLLQEYFSKPGSDA